MSRFDYIRYDEQSMSYQAACKHMCSQLEMLIGGIANARWREAALMKLEEVYMCIGKGIRDDQIKRNGSATLQEDRGDEGDAD